MLANLFIREAQVLAMLEHPGVVPIDELGRRPDGQVGAAANPLPSITHPPRSTSPLLSVTSFLAIVSTGVVEPTRAPSCPMTAA